MQRAHSQARARCLCAPAMRRLSYLIRNHTCHALARARARYLCSAEGGPETAAADAVTAAPSTSKRAAERDAEPATAAKQAKGAEAEVAAEVEASALAGGSEPAPVTTVNGDAAEPTPAETTAHALNGATADAGTGAPEATPAGDASADAAPSGSGAASTAIVAASADADELAADSDEELVNDGDEGGNMVLAQYEKARTLLLRLREQLTLRDL